MSQQSNGNTTTITQSGNFAIMAMNPESIGEALRENLGNEGLTSSDLEKITLPSGGSTSWVVEDFFTGEEKQMDELKGIILHQHTSKAFWSKAFSGEGTLPDCSSSNGSTGVGNPGGPCKQCPKNRFGSKGRGKMCRETRDLFFLREEGMLPAVIAVPPSSLADLRKFNLRLAASGVRLCDVVVGLRLKSEKNQDNLRYSKIRLQVLSQLTPEESAIVREYQKSFLKAFVKNESNNGWEQELTQEHPQGGMEKSEDSNIDIPF